MKIRVYSCIDICTLTNEKENEMNTAELKSYLRDVYELESQIYTYKKLLNLYDRKISELTQTREHVLGGSPTHLRKLLGDNYGYPNERVCTDFLQNMLACLPENHTRSKLEKKLNRSNSFFSQFGVPAILIGFSILLIILTQRIFLPIIIGLVCYFIYVFKVCPDVVPTSKITGEIFHAYEEYYYICIKEQRTEVQPKIDALIKIKDEEIRKNLKAVEILLKKVYSKGIIHSKYRNFIAIAQIYEYLDTGRCSGLEGTNGAYNLFESELRQDIIINKLDEIICRLEEIQRSMYYMTSAISHTNMLLGEISSQLSTSNALLAYNAQCMSNNTVIVNRYNL